MNVNVGILVDKKEIMAEGGKSGRHVVIFSSKTIFLEDKATQALLNEEVDALAKFDQTIDLYFTSHETPSKEMLGKLPER